MGFELFVQTEKNGAQFHGFLPFLCDLVFLFFFYFMGTELNVAVPFHFSHSFSPLSKQVNWGFKEPQERFGTALT